MGLDNGRLGAADLDTGSYRHGAHWPTQDVREGGREGRRERGRESERGREGGRE